MTATMTVTIIRQLITAMVALVDDIRILHGELEAVLTATTLPLHHSVISNQHLDLREQGIEVAELVLQYLDRLEHVLMGWNESEDQELFLRAVETGIQLKEEESRLSDFDLKVGQQLGRLAWLELFS
jgi:hypothetical protein